MIIFDFFFNLYKTYVVVALLSRVYYVIANYHIQDNIIPSFLNYTFVNLPDDIFPTDITIKFSLTTISGTLLYSIDNKDIQVIVSLNDAIIPTFDIEICKEHIYVSILKLCEIERARYQNLTFRIQLQGKMYLQCNEGETQSYKYCQKREFNKVYPIPTFTKSDKLQANLWLVNTPQMGDIYPNGAQLSGCIFNVWYKKELLTMGTHGVKGKCSITCTPNVPCNGGECLETYNHMPICNCTNSFMNGPYCDESLVDKNFNLTERQLQFKTVKISFKSMQIFEINNKVGTVAKLQYDTEVLSFLISSIQNGVESSLKGTLAEKLQKDENHIVIMTFNEKDVYIQYRSNYTKWIMKSIPYYRDLSRDIFENILIICSNWSFSYRNDPKELRWSKLDYSNNQKIDVTRFPKCHQCQNIPNCTIPVTSTGSPVTSSQTKSIRTTPVNTLSSQYFMTKGMVVPSEDTVTRILVSFAVGLLGFAIFCGFLCFGILYVYVKDISKKLNRSDINLNDIESRASLIEQNGDTNARNSIVT